MTPPCKGSGDHDWSAWSEEKVDWSRGEYQLRTCQNSMCNVKQRHYLRED